MLNIEQKQTSYISKTLFHPVITQHWCGISLLFAKSSFLFLTEHYTELYNIRSMNCSISGMPRMLFFGEPSFGVDWLRQSFPWLRQVLHWLRQWHFWLKPKMTSQTNTQTNVEKYYIDYTVLYNRFVIKLNLV